MDYELPHLGYELLIYTNILMKFIFSLEYSYIGKNS